MPLTTRPGYDHIGFPTVTATGPRCGQCKAPHINADAVRDCYAIAQDQTETAAADYRMEQAHLRHLENRGYEAAREQDDYEAAHGVVGFIEAWHLGSPDTCPCDRH